MPFNISIYSKTDNKHTKNFDKGKYSSYITYFGKNNLQGWVMSKKLPMDMFKWSENISYFNEDYLKNYHQDSDVGWLLYVGIKYSEQLEMSHNDLPFLSEKK